MDTRDEIRDFLTSRRAKITPEQAGLPAYGGNRRVTGLRREEVALLAGVSVDYYTRLERGNARGASDSVLEALARALHLDEAERAHLFHLIRAANATAARARHRPASEPVRPSLLRILEAMTTAPAYLRDSRFDILAANRLGRALYAPLFDDPSQPPNHARFIFLNPHATTFYVDWQPMAELTVALLRAEAGRSPHDRVLSELIAELSARSETFRRLWTAHDVRIHRTGAKRFHHPVVGDLSLTFEALDLTADGLRITAYTAEPGSPTEDALKLLSSWAATLDQPAL